MIFRQTPFFHLDLLQLDLIHLLLPLPQSIVEGGINQPSKYGRFIITINHITLFYSTLFYWTVQLCHLYSHVNRRGFHFFWWRESMIVPYRLVESRRHLATEYGICSSPGRMNFSMSSTFFQCHMFSNVSKMYWKCPVSFIVSPCFFSSFPIWVPRVLKGGNGKSPFNAMIFPAISLHWVRACSHIFPCFP